MIIKTEQRYLGFNQYGITAKEAKILCGKLPDYGKEILVKNDDGNHYWVGRVTFSKTHLFVPVTHAFYATLTNWKLVNNQAILSYPNSF